MKEIITYLRQIQANNNREWFNAHKDEFLKHQARLKRNPKGFPADAPYSEYLRLKYYCLTSMPEDNFWEGEGLAKRIASKFATTKPFLDYINRAIDFSRE